MNITKTLASAGLSLVFLAGLSGQVFAVTTVDLGTAGDFAVLAGTSITNVPTSTITGNVGLSPAAGSNYSGLTSLEVTGTIYDVDGSGPAGSVNNPALLTTAKNDLTAAYVDASGRTPVSTIPTELGGTTITTGVYDSASTTFQITAGAGDLVLDGEGDADAVFIFNMNAAGTGLTVGPGSTVSLINDAQACNVFWRVETATIDSTAVFKGNILALTSITVGNGADIEGRLLARNAEVTLISDTITIPECVEADTTTSDTTLPATGVGPIRESNTGWSLVIGSGMVIAILYSFLARKKSV